MAPLVPESADYLLRMLSKVEGMPLDALRTERTGSGDRSAPISPDWTDPWRSTPDFSLATRRSAEPLWENGRSARKPRRRTRAMGEPAAPVLGRGWSRILLVTGWSPFRRRWEAGPFAFRRPGRAPSHLAAVVHILPAPPSIQSVSGPANHRCTGRPDGRDVNCGRSTTQLERFVGRSTNPETARANIRASRTAEEAGGAVFALTLPEALQLHLNFASGFTLETIPLWGDLLACLIANDEPRSRVPR